MIKLAKNVVRAPTSLKTTLPEAARSLEEAWRRRRQELANWRPANGWLIEGRAPESRNGVER